MRRRAGKYTLPHFQVQRAKMILYAAEGMPNDEIAACLDTRLKWPPFGVSVFLQTASKGWRNTFVRVVPGLFPPDLVVQVKALACELPAKFGLPLSRWSTGDLVQRVHQSGLVASVKGITLWCWLHEDAIRPWYHRSWIFPRDPDFAAKARRVMDLYARQGQGRLLKDDEFVISADEKTSIQARRPKYATQRCRPRTPMYVAHEYFRCGAWPYIAALDAHRAGVFGRCEAKNGISPFNRLVEHVMTRPPYNDARQVFRIVDNCSAHRGARAAERLRNLHPPDARACAGSCQLAQPDRNLFLHRPAEGSPVSDSHLTASEVARALLRSTSCWGYPWPTQCLLPDCAVATAAGTSRYLRTYTPLPFQHINRFPVPSL